MITRLRISNYRIIEAFDEKIPPGGLVARGRNGGGKTTILRAIRAALAGLDVGPDAIKEGADQAEIRIDLDKLARIKRVITPTTSTVTVELGEGDAAKRVKNSTKWLADMIGSSTLDPIAFFEAKPRERKEMLLEVLPVKMTEAHLDTWFPDWARTMDDFPRDLLESNGLDACSGFHKFFFEHRAELNATVKRLANELEIDERRIETARDGMPKKVPPIDQARTQRDNAETHLRELQYAKKRAAEEAERTAATRSKIAELRETVKRIRGDDDRAKIEEDHATARNEVMDLDRQIAILQDKRGLAFSRLQTAEARIDAHCQADAIEVQATELEAALAGTSTTAPTDSELSGAAIEAKDAAAMLAWAEKAAELAEKEDALETRRQHLATEKETAATLTKIVDFLRVEAPGLLIAESNGIRGIGIEGENITLDGKKIDALSGREQLLLAIEITRRANEKNKIICCDGLERIDPDMYEEAIAYATRDGYQLIATRVDRGDVTYDAIGEPDAEAAQ